MNDGRPEAREGGEAPESLSDVLASIRALVSAETVARVENAAPEGVIVLTEAMRLDARRDEASEDERREPRASSGAPILDEESLRATINAIVREELRGELGERIGRDLRRMIRREVAKMLEESRKG